MLLYCWGIIVEKNLYSYTDLLAKLEIVRKYRGITKQKKKTQTKPKG